jgi:hypothetical protein
MYDLILAYPKETAALAAAVLGLLSTIGAALVGRLPSWEIKLDVNRLFQQLGRFARNRGSSGKPRRARLEKNAEFEFLYDHIQINT